MKKIVHLSIFITSIFIAQNAEAFSIYVYNKTKRPLTLSYSADALLKKYDNKITINPGEEKQILDMFATCHLKSLDFPLYHLGKSAGSFNLFEVFNNFNEICTRVSLDWIGFTVWDDLVGDNNAAKTTFSKNEFDVPWFDIHINPNGLYGVKAEKKVGEAIKKLDFLGLLGLN